MPEFEIKKAARRALPMQIAFYGPSSSGKTFSALMFAAGLAGEGGKVIVIDTERGRASLYADNKKIMAALPQGFDVIELDAPYHPRRYMEAIDVAEAAGYKVCLLDSASDAWDGPGGCTEMAESMKNMWNIPKLWNKRLMTRIALSGMHVISCLKAQEKTKIIDKTKSGTGKQEYIDKGFQPICEKNFFFPHLLGFAVDPETHLSNAVKCHDDLLDLFREPKLITKLDGERVRKWNDSGRPLASDEQLIKRARAAADEGMEAYSAFWKGITAAQRKALESTHASNKAIAEKADKSSELPDPLSMDPGSIVERGGKNWTNKEVSLGVIQWQEVTA